MQEDFESSREVTITEVKEMEDEVERFEQD